MQLKVRTEQITNFYENADAIIGRLSQKGKRGKYLAVLQTMFDAITPKYKSIQKHMQALREKYAIVNNSSDSKEFILNASGNFTFNKEGASKLADEIEEYLQKTHSVSLDVPKFILRQEDLPTENGIMNLSNQLIAILSPFVISDELKNTLLYGDLEVEPDDSEQEAPALRVEDN